MALSLLCSCSTKHKYPEELTNVIKSGVVAALAGLLYGGLPAARHARKRYIQVSQAEIYTTRVEAVVSEIWIRVPINASVEYLKNTMGFETKISGRGSGVKLD